MLFEIELDLEARATRLDPNLKVKSDCMKMNNSVSFTSKEDQVMFVMPKFEIVSCQEDGVVTVFKLRQLTYFQQFENNPFDRNKKYVKDDTTVLEQAGLKDFDFKTVLGEGAFGKVFLAQFKESGNFYAIKAFRKDILIKKKQIKMAEDEVEIMSKLQNEYLLGMDCIF